MRPIQPGDIWKIYNQKKPFLVIQATHVVNDLYHCVCQQLKHDFYDPEEPEVEYLIDADDPETYVRVGAMAWDPGRLS